MPDAAANQSRSIKEHFNNGVAVITGAGSGLGAGFAKVAALAGMQVVVADISEARAAAIASEISAAGGTAISIHADVTDIKSIKALAASTHECFGEVRLLINNAGIETLGLSWEISDETWERTLGVNLHGVVHTARAFLPAMVAAGKPAFVVNVASVAAIGSGALHAPYFSSKHAVLAFSESLYLELQDKAPQISVSTVLPGPVATRIYEDVSGETDAQARKRGDDLRKLLAVHMQPDEAARIILSQVAEKRFWVSSHPEIMQSWASLRAAYLNTLSNPAASSV